MPIGVYKRTIEHNKRLSEVHKKIWGSLSKNKKNKIIKNLKHSYWTGKKRSNEDKIKMRISHLGKKHTKEHIEKFKKSRFGYRHSLETKIKIGLGNKGKKISKETREKLSRMHKGSKSILWRGGISFKPYSINWNRSLRQFIRERDNNICQLCGLEQNKKLHHIHHIDYNKLNCHPDNLITLCKSCHPKTNHNREKWISIFEL